MRYHVVLRGPSSREPGAARALADAIAARYGVPVDAIADRLAAGGFRVKSGVDLDTAMAYAVDLTKLGGACIVVDAATGEPIETAKNSDPEPIGLAAAGRDVSMGLGALDSGNMVVATLDGAVDPRGDLVFKDEGESLALDASPYEPTELAAPTRSESDFAPPPSEVADDELMLVEDPRQAREAIAEQPVAAIPEPELAPAPPAGPGFAERASRLGVEARRSLATRGRVHVAAGALLVVIAGFVAAHVIGVIQETSAYPPIHKELREAYAEATDPDSHAALPEIREGMQQLVESRQRRIAVTCALVWIAASAGVGFLWFRKIEWERLGA